VAAEVSYGPVWGPDDKPEFFVATFHDITERKLLQNSLEKQALLDPLTLALNRLSFDQRQIANCCVQGATDTGYR
jgi:hypothetical protein